MVTPPTNDAWVLRMSAVRARPWFLGADVSLAAGQSVAIAASAAAATHFADLVQGFVTPVEGVVAVCGEEWRAMSVPRTYALRARTGRIGPSMHWIQNLNVDENVLLAQLDHSQRTEPELRAQALALAQQLGLDAVPRSRPHDTAPGDLLASAVVRAFLGAPALVVIEPLPADASDALRTGLGEVGREASARGTTVIWLGDPVWLGDAVGVGSAPGAGQHALSLATVLELVASPAGTA